MLNTATSEIQELLGKEANDLLSYTCTAVPKETLTLPGVTWVDQVTANSDRNNRVMRSLCALFTHGRLTGTGYLSLLPVDQGIEHSAGASFAPNPIYFDPENIVRFAIEAGCNGVASTLGILGIVSRKYAHKIPFIVKLNHNELLTYPNHADQTMYASVKQAFDMGAVGVGATIYFGSEQCDRQILEVSEAFELAHDLGMCTILWCYLRNPAFKIDGVDYHASADLTGQANYLGATIQADIIKQKQATVNGGYIAVNQQQKGYGKYSDLMYDKLCSDHPIDLCRYQVLNNFAGKAGLINSGGSSGKNDKAQAVRTAIINKRAGGMGMISGRKTFQKPMNEGIEMFHAIQDVYLNPEITVA
ncbi:MAG: Fructose-bisphosphate aldolase class 1 [Chlamydiae bacterium]|nr:Fructose-bisphosphate aldolase class 1 [Chlamydiota bacterium]